MRSHKRTVQQFHNPNYRYQQKQTPQHSKLTSFYSFSNSSPSTSKSHHHPTKSVSFSQVQLDQQWNKIKAKWLKSSNQSFTSKDQPLMINQFSKQNELTLNRRVVIYREQKCQLGSQYVQDVGDEPDSQQYQYYPPNKMINSMTTNEDDKENINYYGQDVNEEEQQQGECFCCVEGCQRCAGDCIPQMMPISFSKRCSTVEQVSEPSNTTMNSFLHKYNQPKQTVWTWKQDCIAYNTRGKNKLK